ncbi:hypothetical protein AVEN_40626-1 [Araneus ventricosus]|uniref:Uncharacterized protein n=1 Tax=Araneus ventricosus TaxID=182803 RepID=A0A4Y2LIK8_ARAVE|nr:hypothetical protein AVEN_40626-1 [Araneus ventricosus]
MSRKIYLTFEEAIKRRLEDDTNDDQKSEIDIVVFPPETAETSDEDKGNDNILNHGNDYLPCDTAREIEVHSKNKPKEKKKALESKHNKVGSFEGYLDCHHHSKTKDDGKPESNNNLPLRLPRNIFRV